MTMIRPRLDDRLLGELPRFFGGLLPTVREAFQNAYRAGATLVEVQTSQNGSILTISNNGQGCPDPQILLSAGATGWGEEIVEPADLGFFSFLNPYIIKRAIAESAGWRAGLGTANALRPEAEVEVCSGDVRNGFGLTLHFTNQRPDIRDVVAREIDEKSAGRMRSCRRRARTSPAIVRPFGRLSATDRKASGHGEGRAIFARPFDIKPTNWTTQPFIARAA